jgi:hypothetical protein
VKNNIQSRYEIKKVEHELCYGLIAGRGRLLAVSI